MTWLLPKVIAATVAIIIAIWAFARSRRRDRPRVHGSSGQLGVALQEIEGLFVESKKHVIEAEQDEHKEEDDSGED